MRENISIRQMAIETIQQSRVLHFQLGNNFFLPFASKVDKSVFYTAFGYCLWSEKKKVKIFSLSAWGRKNQKCLARLKSKNKTIDCKNNNSHLFVTSFIFFLPLIHFGKSSSIDIRLFFFKNKFFFFGKSKKMNKISISKGRKHLWERKTEVYEWFWWRKKRSLFKYLCNLHLR